MVRLLGKSKVIFTKRSKRSWKKRQIPKSDNSDGDSLFYQRIETLESELANSDRWRNQNIEEELSNFLDGLSFCILVAAAIGSLFLLYYRDRVIDVAVIHKFNFDTQGIAKLMLRGASENMQSKMA